MTAAPLLSRDPALDHLDRVYEAQQRNRARVNATSVAERREKLRRFEQAMLAHRDDIRASMWADYKKPAAEVDLSEIYPAVGEARHARRHLRKWMKPRRVSTPLALLGSRSRIVHEPKGAVLIISPWNFPFNLTLGPLVSAVAAGNCVIIKPSEMTPNASACMKRILADVFSEDEVAVVEGDASVAAAVLQKKFDHIFFTGSPRVGKLVMKAAAEHLSSVTLELGGKSPVIVDRTANLDEAAKKIAWGKFFNCGQICIAPDYLIVDETVREPFLEKLRAQVAAMGDDSRGVLVNDVHASRIRKLFDSAVAAGAKVFFGGEFRDRAVAPTVLTNVPPDAAVMQEEIFGPLLPVLTYRDLGEALRIINAKEKPLVLYVFSRNRKVVERIVSGTTAGGTAINDTLVHFYQLNLPFGGIGNSGIGKGHGVYGFEAFSNARGVLEQVTRFSPIQMLYPPYKGRLKEKLIDFTVRWL